MIRFALLAWLLTLCLGLPAHSAPLQLRASDPGPIAPAKPDSPVLGFGLSEPVIAVTSSFRGATLTLFGATDLPPPYQLAIIVRGPSQQVTVLRREQYFALWFARNPVHFEDVPGFFAVVSDGGLASLGPPSLLDALALRPEASATLIGAPPKADSVAAYRAGLRRLMVSRGFFIERPAGIRRDAAGLFSVRIAIPANAPVGVYRAQTLVLNGGRVIASNEVPFAVAHVGIEREIIQLAHHLPLVYGLLCIGIAIGAGWAAARWFRQD